MELVKNQTIEKFSDDLSSRAPVPGGGTAAGVLAGLGASLTAMVCELSLGKKKYAEFEPFFSETLSVSRELRKEFLTFSDRDEEAFLPLSAAYAMPKETEEEKQKKAAVMEECLLQAGQVPLDLMKKIHEFLPTLRKLSECGSLLAISDAGSAAAAFRGAFTMASLNVTVNVRYMKKEENRTRFLSERDEILSSGLRLCEEIIAITEKRLTKKRNQE